MQSWVSPIHSIISHLKNRIYQYPFALQSLVEELKKHLDAGLHRQLEGLYDEYNVCMDMKYAANKFIDFLSYFFLVCVHI